jgi:vitamin B12 transporter
MRQTIGVMMAACLALSTGLLAGQESTRKVYTPGNDVTPPRVVTRVNATYPKDAMDARIQGEVRLALVVETDGTPSGISVTKHLSPSLDDAATDALKQFRFEPGKRNSEAVPVRIEMEMSFRLQ